MLQKSGNANLCKQKFQVKAYLGPETFDIFLRSLHSGNSQLATRNSQNSQPHAGISGAINRMIALAFDTSEAV